MGKIDLHIHTIKTKSDVFNRDIPNSQNFLNQLMKAEVSIAAITNHNILDIEQFNELEKICKEKNILLLPGVELDVFINNDKEKRRQMNVIVEKSDNITNFLKENPNISYDNPININIVIEYFNNIKAIFYIDIKSTRQGVAFNESEIKDYFGENFTNACVFDGTVNNFDFFIQHDDVNCLIGTDIDSWNENNYIEKSKKLIDCRSFIDSFDSLFDIFKNKETKYVFDKFHLTEEYDDIKIGEKDNDSYDLKNFYIFKETINVIFGPKATGKTKILNFLNKKLKSTNKKHKYYCQDEKNDKHFLEINNDDWKDYEKYIDEFKRNIDYINKYNENEKYNSLNDIYKYVRCKNKCNIKLFELKKPEINENNNNDIKDIDENCNRIKKIANNKDDLKEIYDKSIDIETLSNKIFISKNSDYFKYCFKKKTNEIINEIWLKWKNKTTENQTFAFGLFEKFKKRWNLNKIIENINENVKKIKSEKQIAIKEFEIPQENENYKNIKLGKKLFCNLNNKSKKDWVKYLSNLINDIKRDKYISNFKNLNDFKNKLLEIFYNDNKDFIIKNDLFKIEKNWYKDEDNKIELSHGEKNYICLIDILNNDYDYYLLDEPEIGLNNKIISNQILESLKEKIKEKKTIVMTTHNSILGINSKPKNYILRELPMNENEKNYPTYIGTLYDIECININNEAQKIKLKDKIFEYFEGKEKLYNERASVYGYTKK